MQFRILNYHVTSYQQSISDPTSYKILIEVDKSHSVIVQYLHTLRLKIRGKHLRCFNANRYHCTKNKFSIKDFFSKCDQIRKKLQFWSHLLKKSLMENVIFCAAYLNAREQVEEVVSNKDGAFLTLLSCELLKSV